ncbi:GntR family transcriptional regulator [Intrasporangium sp.]|uniref:GntR family transcriptional regulator n=1 Tax=Intrasporangium sp. TaxID=1925024 RepID=UPI0029397B0F|nr:GntR family transcriptional regulator [Intrasporangium sp.]MDV3221472.1 GntR family transcriptional regulator [Intrasporangium sp.]
MTTTALSALSGEKGRLVAHAAIREAITRGDLVPAQRLVEQELAEQHGVTRGSVRAALIDLSAEGLVERVPHRGSRVRVVTLDEAVAITEVRMMLEGLCAAKAAARATPEEAARLRDLGGQMRTAVESGDANRYSQLNIQLHASVRDLGNQPVAADLLERLNGQLVRHRFRLAQRDGRPRQSLGEHLEIIDAIASHDPDRATRAVHAHLASVIEALKAKSQELP